MKHVGCRTGSSCSPPLFPVGCDATSVVALPQSLAPNSESRLNFHWSSSPQCVIVPHLSAFARSHSVTQMAESMTLFPVLCSPGTGLTFPACASQHLLEGSGRPLLGRTMPVGPDDVQLRQLPRRQSRQERKTRRADEWGWHFKLWINWWMPGTAVTLWISCSVELGTAVLQDSPSRVFARHSVSKATDGWAKMSLYSLATFSYPRYHCGVSQRTDFHPVKPHCGLDAARSTLCFFRSFFATIPTLAFCSG